MISWNARFAAVAVLLAGTALFLRAHARNQFVPQRIALASFPLELKSWAGTDVPIPVEILNSLGPGEFLQRTYSSHASVASTHNDQSGGESSVDLYLAYLPNWPASYHHVPQNCLVGSGWTEVKSGIITLALPGDMPFPANRYVVARGDDRQLILFWYSARGRRLASEDQMNFHLVLDSLRFNRRDNALIRMNTELLPGESPDQAEKRLLSFAAQANPLLNNYLPR